MNALNIEKRIYALVIDLLITSVLITLLSSFIKLDSFRWGNLTFLDKEWTVRYSVKFIILMIYYLLFDCFNVGLSFGKKIMNLKIIKSDNTYPTLFERISRTFLKLFFLFTIFLPLVISYYLYKDEILYDKIVKTKVVVK